MAREEKVAARLAALGELVLELVAERVSAVEANVAPAAAAAWAKTNRPSLADEGAEAGAYP